MFRTFALILAMAVPAGAAFAQDQTLADIRAELSTLYGDVTALRTELVASGQAGQGATGSTPLDRLNSIEAELTRQSATAAANTATSTGKAASTASFMC